ncbi:MAG: LytTR family transcriptional regulator [Saprospiraceae bacterium]|nr:LytTR family transcriptional regulator [Saprospiraceae bacterium]
MGGITECSLVWFKDNRVVAVEGFSFAKGLHRNNSIVYIEGLGDYVKIFTTNGALVSYEQLAYLEEKLPEEHFLRVHKSYIICMDKVRAFSGSAVKVSGKQIPAGRTYKERLARFGR